MRKKKSNSILAGFLAFVMLFAQVLGVGPVFKVSAATLDGIYDTWELKNPTTSNEVVEKTDEETLHFKSGTGNDNGANPAIIISKEAGQLTDGFLEFTVDPVTAGAQTRFGAYVRYQGVQDCVFVGYDAGGWFWQVYNGGDNPWYTGTRQPAPEPGSSSTLRIEFAGDVMTASLNGTDLFGNVDISSVKHAGGIGFKASTFSGQQSEVNLSAITYTGQKDNSGGTVVVPKYNVSGKVVDTDGTAIANAVVTVEKNSVKTGADGTYTLENIKAGTYNLNVAKSGYETVTKEITVTDDDVTVEDIALTKTDGIPAIVGTTIASDVMKVVISETFPQVKQYELLQGEDAGKRFYGQENDLTTMKVNDVEVTPEVTSVVEDNKVTYTLTAKDEENDIDAVFTTTLEVIDNTVEFKITDIVDNKIVKTIEFPNQNLVSVRSTQTNANLQGANMSVNTHVNGDSSVSVDAGMNVSQNALKGYMYAFVSDDTLSAGLWSNSENKVTSDWQRVTATAADKTEYKEIGLSSTYWTYQKTAEHRKEDGTIETEDGTVLESKDEMPCVKVAIASDANSDGVINWQDGAIEYRGIMNQLNGGETVPDLVAYRIAMNFGSQAQNPFLMTLDNVKKISLHTDGLGQSILLKGYGSEGHDSGHLNYADIGKRIGGAEDMKTLLAKGKEYGATFGIHVNASETYPESKYFTEDRLLKKADGTYSYGWNWIDQGININADYDLRNGRAQRFLDLYDELGGAANDLDFIYVDVWGNGQSGDNGTWASSQLSKEIKSLGWRVAGEWGYAMANESTFQHWAADLTYGGYSLKGINSTITRFLYNEQKDSWVANYSEYGGGAEQPLLGGYSMKDFEGWQGRSDYAAYVKNLYNVNVPSKFLQHYSTMTWETGTPVTMTDNGQTYSWTPDMKATLQDDLGNEVAISRLSNDYAGEKELYRSRSITYNGVEILKGSESNQSYLIPWFWNETGEDLATADQKLYHWNTTAGTTTWTLPNEWKDVTDVKMYKLTDLGKVEEQTITVVDGQVTLTAEAQTPYVLHKGAAANKDVTWSEGMHIVDSGFNSDSLDAWTVNGTEASVVRSQGANLMLSFTGESSVSQEITDLTPGQNYAVYVGVDNRSTSKAYMTLDVNGETSTNYTNKSIARNYIKAYAHNTNTSTSTVNNTSYFQNMYLFFTAPSTGKVTLTLGREAGDGASYFDDIRVCENEAANWSKVDGRTIFTQDFEESAQGAYPFVLGGIEGVEDNRTHLSEKHDKYTQVGWNGKEVDDVINGDWSLKVNGLTGRRNMVYQTIPQNFRFDPNKTYNISFKYEAGSDNTYALAVGDGSVADGISFETTPLEGTIGNENDPAKQGSRAINYKFMMTGAESGQSWFGIYSTQTGAVVPEGAHAEFGGYKDFILDDLVIEESKAQKTELGNVIAEAEKIVAENYSDKTASDFTKALEAAKTEYNDFDTTQDAVDSVKDLLTDAMSKLVRTGITVSGTITDNTGAKAAGVTVTLSEALAPTNADEKAANTMSTTTDANGTYTISGVTFGRYEITADSKAYVTMKDSIVSEDGETPDVVKDLVLTQATTDLSGIVSCNNVAVEGATVTIAADGAKTQTVKTDAKGTYSFKDVVVKDYSTSIVKDGYDGLTIVIPTTKVQPTTKNIMIQIASTVDYFNDFSKGIGALQDLAGNTTSTTKTESDGGAKIMFQGGGHSNVVDELAGTMKDGVMEADITSLDGDGTRFGILLRASNMNSRIYLGAGDANGKWFAEYWKAGGNAWSAMYDGPSFNQNEKIHVKAEIIGQALKFWVNDQLVMDITMDVPATAGYVGFTRRSSGSFLIDNLSVTSYDAAPEGSETVSGNVMMKDGSSSEGASVELMQGDTVVKTTTVGALGAYKFKKVAEGEYTVKVTKGGSEAQTTVTVQDEEFYVVVDTITLEASKVDKATLINKITEAEGKEESKYTEDSYAKLKTALEAAKKVNADADATQAQVDKASNDLTTAINELVPVTIKNGWYDVGNKKKYYENNVAYKNKWYLEKESKIWYYFGNDEFMVTNWKQISKTWYYFDSKGAMKTGWQKVSGKWYYMEKSGAMKTGWQKIDSQWYYMLKSGVMTTGWQKVDGQWYYMNKSGKMVTGWVKVDGNWYYLKANGKMATGWVKDGGKWYFMNTSGKMTTGWKKVSGKWYYMYNSGKMATGWIKYENKYYKLSLTTGAWTGETRITARW